MEAWRIARWREAVPSEFRSIVQSIAFNKDAFSKGSGAFGCPGRIRSACTSKRDVLQVRV